ncbi:hypothetical protein [Asticcacaulis machinosus]|uniref:Ribbon-helix-helix protein, copG family n=1 Tax=Asticcacaulis machinosus TaxID=2984211 RepID=A0ABT5HNJ3_9CAUL|nr:hypothetical protein [Asticcacaulis machinosus]MDC7677790.1 hypothetical protein [Asticcacaulis machinosus]
METPKPSAAFEQAASSIPASGIEPKRRKSIVIAFRVTAEEYQEISHDAGGDDNISAYCRSKVLKKPTQRKRVKVPAKDQIALSQIAARRGRDGIATNLASLARAFESGSPPPDEHIAAVLKEARDNDRIIRHLLMRALGIYKLVGPE